MGDDFSGGAGDDPSTSGVFDANNSGFFSSTRSSPRSQGSQYDSSGERFSRKVFVGGLPPDIDEGEESKHLILSLYLIRWLIYRPLLY